MKTKLSSPLLLAVVLTCMLVLAACQSTPAPTSATPAVGKAVQVAGGSYMNVSPQELQAMLDKKDFVLVNVHIPFAGNLPKTDLSLPYDVIGHNLDKLPSDKNAKIVLYCQSGSMSTEASQTLVMAGYTNVFNLDGGMNAWSAAGYTIEK